MVKKNNKRKVTYTEKEVENIASGFTINWLVSTVFDKTHSFNTQERAFVADCVKTLNQVRVGKGMKAIDALQVIDELSAEATASLRQWFEPKKK